MLHNGLFSRRLTLRHCVIAERKPSSTFQEPEAPSGWACRLSKENAHGLPLLANHETR
jgi:hypothetical protein